MEFKQEFDNFSKKNYLSARKALRNQVQKAFHLSNGFKHKPRCLIGSL